MIFKRTKFKNRRLMTKLLITYMLLTVLPMGLIGYIAYSQYTKSIEEQVGEYIPKLLDQTNRSIDYYLSDLKQLPDLLYSSGQVVEVLRKDSYQNKSSLMQDRFSVNSFLNRTYINGGEDILGVFVFSKNRLFSSSKVPFKGFESSIMPFGQDLDLEGEQAILLPSQTPLTFEGNPPYILLMRQITDTENRMNLGTMFIAVELSFIKEIVESLETVNDADVWLVNSSGQIIYHTNPKLIGQLDQQFAKYPAINGSFRSVSADKGQLISISRTGADDWALLHRVYVEHLTERTNLVKNATIIAFLVIVVVGTLFAVLLAWNVSRPLHGLTKLMKQVEKGDFDVDIPVTTSDEVGRLAKGLQSMLAKIKELITMNYHIQLQQKEAELYALQSQINPHFMYNTLETIGMAVEEDDDDTVVEMVSLLGRMLRFSISNKEKVVPVEQEIQHMNDYLTIQKIRFEDRIEFTIANQMGGECLMTPKFILQPIVENSIKHGLEQTSTCKIAITIEPNRARNEVLMTITDNGPGIPESVLQELLMYIKSDPLARRDSKFGLINVHGRITMMYGEQFGLSIANGEEGGTVVTVKIPFLAVEVKVEETWPEVG